MRGHQMLLICLCLFHWLKRMSKSMDFHQQECQGDSYWKWQHMGWKHNVVNNCHCTRCHHTPHQKLLTGRYKLISLFFPLVLPLESKLLHRFFPPPTHPACIYLLQCTKGHKSDFKSSSSSNTGRKDSMIETGTCSSRHGLLGLIFQLFSPLRSYQIGWYMVGTITTLWASRIVRY